MTPIQFNCMIAGIAGTIFSVGWWLMIDAHAQRNSIIQTYGIYHLPGVFGTLSLMCINCMPTELLSNSYSSHGSCCTPLVARMTLFLFFMASFGCVIGAFYILINDFMLDKSRLQWPGYAVCLQNVFILGSNLLLRFGKKREEIW